MRLQNKYKIFNKLSFIFYEFPAKVFRFHRTKWKKIQKLFLQKKIKKSFFWSSILLLFSKRWFLYKSKYTNGLHLKRYFDCLFDKAFSILFFKKLKDLNKKLDKILEYSIYTAKPEFRIDIFFWKLNFFSSCYEARSYINNKKITLNNQIVSHSNYFLKRGDIISFDFLPYYTNLKFKSLLEKKLHNFKMLTFIEIDYYTNSIIVLKNYNELVNEDLIFFMSNYYNIAKFKTFIE